MKNNTFVALAAALLLTGCAGSAQHAVVSAHTAVDGSMSCAQIDADLVKVQLVIDEVNRDKQDISGADVIDGILWFPFNLIAKSENYEEALDAADKRIANLQQLRVDKGCKQISADEQRATVSRLSDELRALGKLYQGGALTLTEYEAAKKKVLDGVGY